MDDCGDQPRRGVLPCETFRVHVGDRYYIVRISKDRATMLSEMTEHGFEPHPDLSACCYGVSSDHDDLVGLTGVIWFSFEELGGGVVSHEMAHAAFRLLEATGVEAIPFVAERAATQGGFDEAYRASSTEERFCETLETLVKEFWRAYYDRNLGKPGDHHA